jgi:hypothetical protein
MSSDAAVVAIFPPLGGAMAGTLLLQQLLDALLESPLAAVSRKRRLCKLLCLLIIAKEGIRVATTQGFACPKGGVL